ncbi:MAG: FAD-dependent thymidylate synthase [Ignisphaera sp.]|nr:FAD-dependent thymidylate synthase [Ignisphaera sp.]
MVKLKWNKPTKTAYLNHLDSIKVTVLSAPTVEHLMSYIPEFTLATWEDSPKFDYTLEQREESLNLLMNGKLLPTAMETISITFMVEGLDLIDVTHLIRHRVFSFSAQCTADRDMREDNVLVKPSILNNPEFLERYIKLHDDAKQLYADMVDSKEVSIFDARTVLPRSLSNFYYVRGNLKDIIGFINTRKDEAIQPESDNVVAIRLYQQLVSIYPMIKDIIKFGGQDTWFVNTAKEGHNSMAYMPKPANDVFEHTPDRFIYQKRRDEFPGAETYLNILGEVL